MNIFRLRSESLHIFNTREAYSLVAASMFMGLFVSLSFQGMIAEMEDNTLLDRLILILGELAILVPALFVLNQRQIKFIQVLPLKKTSFLTILVSILFVTGVIGLVAIFETMVTPYFPVPEFLQQIETDLFSGNRLDNIILIVAACLVAPVAEEFLFRGILHQSIFYHFDSILPAMVIPTVIFALFHIAYLFYLPALIELVFLAMLLAWLMAKTANILIPILVHSLFNLSAFSSIFSADLDEASTLADLGIVSIILSIVLCVGGWIYFKNMGVVVLDEVYVIPSAQEKLH
ncbi:MAG: CPBP family intramembrane metalloprotease [Candidatus Marinimicrobia bacterium]|nr:CPBP family intramembrane metalloprotease [Candidatus Neomarinimicrobiota bacterium]